MISQHFEINSNIEIGIRTILLILSQAFVQISNAQLIFAYVQITRAYVKTQFSRFLSCLLDLFEYLKSLTHIFFFVRLHSLNQ